MVGSQIQSRDSKLSSFTGHKVSHVWCSLRLLKKMFDCVNRWQREKLKVEEEKQQMQMLPCKEIHDVIHLLTSCHVMVHLSGSMTVCKSLHFCMYVYLIAMVIQDFQMRHIQRSPKRHHHFCPWANTHPRRWQNECLTPMHKEVLLQNIFISEHNWGLAT